MHASECERVYILLKAQRFSLLYTVQFSLCIKPNIMPPYFSCMLNTSFFCVCSALLKFIYPSKRSRHSAYDIHSMYNIERYAHSKQKKIYYQRRIFDVNVIRKGKKERTEKHPNASKYFAHFPKSMKQVQLVVIRILNFVLPEKVESCDFCAQTQEKEVRWWTLNTL